MNFMFMNIKQFIIFLLLTSQVNAQRASEISFTINQQNFTVKVNFTPTQIPIVTFFRDSIQIKTDTLNLGETKLYFRSLDRDSFNNIHLFEYNKEYGNGEYSNETKNAKHEKMLSLDIYEMNIDERCKMYTYNKKTKKFNTVNGMEFICKPVILSNNPNYLISNRSESDAAFHFITTLYTVKKLKCIPVAEMIGYTETGSLQTPIVELYKIDKRNRNRKTMIDRQMSYRGCYECQPIFGNDLYFTPTFQYWEEHYNDFETYRLGVHQKLIKNKNERD